MAHAIPLVRAISLLPALRWLNRQGLQSKEILGNNGMAGAPYFDPLRPIPLLKAGALLRDISARVGPDAPCRIVSDTGDLELVQVGRVALGTTTPAEALGRISAALPFFCSHELLNIEAGETGCVVRHAYGARFDAETLHLMSQYALAVLDRICAMSGAAAPRITRAALPPHPEFGVSHLEPWFGEGRVAASTSGALMVTVPNTVALRHFPKFSRDRSAELARFDLKPLRTGGGFADSVRTLVGAMLDDGDGVPEIGQLADSAGISARTAQRWLKDEGTSFKAILDDARREQATRLVSHGDEPISAVAGRLGYSKQSSLHRSMLRWTGQSPSAYRKSG